MQTHAEMAVVPPTPTVDAADAQQATPTWPLIVVLVIAMALAWRPADPKKSNRRAR